MLAKLWDKSHLFVCIVALVIQGGAMAKILAIAPLQLPLLYVASSLSYIRWCLIFFPSMGEYRRIKRYKHHFNDSWQSEEKTTMSYSINCK